MKTMIIIMCADKKKRTKRNEPHTLAKITQTHQEITVQGTACSLKKKLKKKQQQPTNLFYLTLIFIFYSFSVCLCAVHMRDNQKKNHIRIPMCPTGPHYQAIKQ